MRLTSMRRALKATKLVGNFFPTGCSGRFGLQEFGQLQRHRDGLSLTQGVMFDCAVLTGRFGSPPVSKPVSHGPSKL